MKIGIVEYDFEEIVNEWVREECREEAKEILSVSVSFSTTECLNIDGNKINEYLVGLY